MRIWIWLSVAVAVVVAVALYLYAVGSPLRISAAEARQRLQERRVDVVVDVRTVAERSSLGFYPGAVHIQAADLEKVMSVRYPDPATRLLLYCNTGQRARAAAEKLQGMGYTNVAYIMGSHTSLQTQ